MCATTILDEPYPVLATSKVLVEHNDDFSSGTSITSSKSDRTKTITLDVIIKLGQITEVPYPLKDVKEVRKRRFVSFIRKNKFDYSHEVLAVTVGMDMNNSYTLCKPLTEYSQKTAIVGLTLSAAGGSNVLRPAAQVPLVDGVHGFKAFKQLFIRFEQSQWNGTGLKISCGILEAGMMFAKSHEIIFYCSSCRNLAMLVLFCGRFLGIFNNDIIILRKFELQYVVQFFKSSSSNIASWLQYSIFSRGASASTCFTHVRVVKFLLRFRNRPGLLRRKLLIYLFLCISTTKGSTLLARKGMFLCRKH